MSRTKRTAALAALTALGLALVTPAEAGAATGYDRCPNGHVCVFDLPNGNGAMAWFRVGSPDLRQQGMDNRASSFRNRTGRDVQTYDGYRYQDPLIYFGNSSDGTNIAGCCDNRMSSLRVV